MPRAHSRLKKRPTPSAPPEMTIVSCPSRGLSHILERTPKVAASLVALSAAYFWSTEASPLTLNSNWDCVNDMPEGAKAFCERCLRAFLDLMEGESPSDFHRTIKKRIEASTRCKACYESYRKTVRLCRKAISRGRSPDSDKRLLEALRRHLSKTH